MTEAKPLSALTALLQYQQADEDGVMVLASRQAIHEVSDYITSLQAENAALVEALRQIDDDPPVIPFDPAYDEGTRNKQWIRYFKEVAKNARFNPTSSGAALLKRLEDAEAEVTELQKLVQDAEQLANDRGCEITRLRQNQRTPHTYEVCAANGCSRIVNGPRQGEMQDVCARIDCPIRSQEKK